MLKWGSSRTRMYNALMIDIIARLILACSKGIREPVTNFSNCRVTISNDLLSYEMSDDIVYTVLPRLCFPSLIQTELSKH
jgi:hypothetical protein